MKDKTGLGRRKFIRLDSVFPVAFQFISPDERKPLSPWYQGFTADIAKGGICLSIPLLDERALEFLRAGPGLRLNLKIQIPLFSPAVLAVTSLSWIRQEKDSLPGPYLAGLKYEKINAKENQRIMRLVYFKAASFPLALAAVIILFISFAASAHYNLRLFSSNQRLIESLVEAARDYSLASSELEGLRRERDGLKAKLSQAGAKIKSITQELEDKTKSLERGISSLNIERGQELLARESEIQKLKSMLSRLEQERQVFQAEIDRLQRKEGETALRLEKILDKKTVLEKENFDKMYQWLRVHQNPRTGLLVSFEGDDKLQDQAFTYDQALAVIAFSYFKDYKLAEKILDFYSAKASHRNGYFNCYYASSAEPAEFIIHTGPNLWLGLAVLQYSRACRNSKYLGLAKDIAGWIIDLQGLDQDKGLRGGPEEAWFSTEHNLDGFAFFNMLYQLTQDRRYQNAADAILSWLKAHAYDSPDVPIKRGRGDATIATDTYAWSIASLGPERLAAMDMDPEGIMKFAEDNCSVNVDYLRPGGQHIALKGFDFAKARNIARGGVVSAEWTGQMALSYQILSRYFSSHSEVIKEKIYQEKANEYLGELTKMIISSPSRSGQGEGCLPYASGDFVDTGHGWFTPVGKDTGSVSATAYALFAYYGFNPLELGPETSP